MKLSKSFKMRLEAQKRQQANTGGQMLAGAGRAGVHKQAARPSKNNERANFRREVCFA